MKRAVQWIAVGLLLTLFALLTIGSRHNAFTVDEPAHIAVGYSLLARGAGAFWLIPQYGNPPLLDELEALLFYLTRPKIPLEQLSGWPSSFMPLIRALNLYLLPIEQAELLTRLPTMLLTVLLGAVVFRWGKDLWGLGAGLIGLVALTFDPTLLAHGRLATTDVGTVTLGTAALYATWRWMRRPAWRWALVMGVLLGLTMLAKASGVVWILAAGLMVVGAITQRRRDGRAAHYLAQAVVAGGSSLLMIWAGYGFSWGSVQGFPFPLPAPAHWSGLLSQALGGLSASERWVFALGEQKQGNWWWYFPLAFLIKNPLPMLIGWGIGLVVLLRQPPSWLRILAMGTFPILYAALAISRGINIGYRHMLAVHPFLYLIIGGGLWQWSQRLYNHRWRWWLLGVLATWCAVSVLQSFPYEIAYFNELGGGARNGYRYLADSNVDWGQGSKALREYLVAHPGPTPNVAYHFTGVQPDLYGIEMKALPPQPDAPPLTAPFHPLPGRYVIGVDALQRGWPADPDMYAWFRQVEPTARLASSFFVYDLGAHPLEWFSQCTVPALPLDEQAVARGFGQTDLYRADFDCTAAWLYPTGGTAAGAYGLHHALLSEEGRPFPFLFPLTPHASDLFVARRLAGARLSLDLRRYTEQFPAFVLYEQEHPPLLPSRLPVLTLPATIFPSPSAPSTTLPVSLDGPLTFRGAAAFPDRDDLDVETWWQVTEGPITRPFSIMAHLLTPEGILIGVADGLGVSPLSLRPGDMIVQRHRFKSSQGKNVWLRTGAYWQDTARRWAISSDPEADAIFVHLEIKP